MFQLIVAVISIALVAALAIASIYYGGPAFQKSTLRANVTTLVNAGQQIAGAQALYVNDNGGNVATAIASLSPSYLAAAPGISAAASGAWAIDATGKFAFVTLSATDTTTVCAEVAHQANTTDGFISEGQFGCADATGTAAPTSAAAAGTFAFKID